MSKEEERHQLSAVSPLPKVEMEKGQVQPSHEIRQ